MDSTNPLLRLFLFGAPRAEIGDQEVEIHRRKVKALLIFLALTKTPHQRDTLAALLWAERDHRRAHGSLRRHLSELNRALGGGWMEAGRETIGLRDPVSLWLDTDQFQGHLAELRTHPHGADGVCPACIPLLTKAAALYRGDFLAGFSLPDCPAFDEWQFFQADGLRQSFAGALDRLVQAHLEKGEAAAAIPHARRRLGLDPLHEPAHCQLIRLYLETGERAAALRQYQLCVKVLDEELGVLPSEETAALCEELRRGDSRSTAKTHPAGEVPHNLPAPVTPLIGRQAELAELGQLFADPAIRLVTILGPGGMGKTRLALAAAEEQLGHCGDGVFFVPLAPIRAAEHMVPAIAEAIGFRFQADDRPPAEQLLGYLRPKQVLLVLDSTEHLPDGIDLIRDLLQASPGLRLLVTSRERLQLSGETVFALGSLDFPTWETPEEALAYSAIQLFVQTAQRIRPGFRPAAGDLQYAARICRLVGGMPLGIILAASWISTLSPAEIAAELTQGFDLLETELRDLPDRQRSMRAVLAYSWQRLGAEERDGYMRLSVFRGGFTPQAARAITGVSLRTLAHLVDKSIVQRAADGRCDVHELLRQYAAEQLRAAGQEQKARGAHSAFYLDFVHRREAALAGHQQSMALAELGAEFENIRTAWHWAIQEGDETGVGRALGGMFRWFWLMRSRQREGQELLRQALEAWAPAPRQKPSPVWMRISARLMEQQGPWLIDPTAARARAERALDFAHRRGDCAETAFCAWALGLAIASEGRAASFAEDLQPAIRCYGQSLRHFRRLGDRFYIAQVLENLGHCYRLMGRRDRAIPPLQESLEIRRETGDRFGMARSVRELGFVAYFNGADSETESAWQQAYELQRDLGDPQGIADSLFNLAALSLTRGDWQGGEQLAGQILSLASQMNSLFYQQSARREVEIAASMKQSAPGDGSCSFPNALNPFTAQLFGFLFTPPSMPLGQRTGLRTVLGSATTDTEVAVCLLFAAEFLARAGDRSRAARFLAVAECFPRAAEGWAGQLPEIAALRRQLATTYFCEAWEQGRTMDIQTAVGELRNLLDSWTE